MNKSLFFYKFKAYKEVFMPNIENVEKDQHKTIQSEMAKQARKIAQVEARKMMNTTIDEENDEDDNFLEFDGEGEIADYEDEDDNHQSFSGSDGSTTTMKDDEMSKILKEIEERDAFDIFTDVGEKWAKEGQIVRYAVNKNGKRLTSVDHPLTWEEIQTRFGGGNYKIEARLPALANRYLKAQSKYLASPTGEAGEGRIYPTQIKKAETEKETTLQEALKLMELQAQKEEERRRYEDHRAEKLRLEADQKAREAKEEAKREAQEKLSAQERLMERMMEMNRPKESFNITQLTPIITALAPLLLKKDEPRNDNKETFEMMMKMQEMTNKQIEAMNKNFERQVGTLAESIKEIAKSNNQPTKGNKDIDAFALLELAQKSEARAFEKFNLMNELASEKAREMAELKEDSSPAFDKESSTFDKLLSTLGPVIASSLLAPKTPSQVAPIAQPQPTRAISAPVPRSSVSSSRTTNQPVRRTVVEERTTRNQVQTIAEVKNEGNNFQSSTGSRSNQGRSSVGPSVFDDAELLSSTGVRNVNEDYSKERFAHESNAFRGDNDQGKTSLQAVETVATLPTTNTNGRNSENLEKIKETIFPIALESFFSGDTTVTLDQVAERSVNALRDNGIDLSTVQRDFDDVALNEILADVPEDTHDMIKGLRNEVLTKISNL
jgi:hypothetical protein